MSKITVIGAGVMGSTIVFPACDNGHSVSIVGTPYDRQIIERLKEDRYHLNLKRELPKGIEFFQIEDIDEAIKGADIIVAGISSYGVKWFRDEIVPMIPDSAPVLIVTKGVHSKGNGEICSFVNYFEQKCQNRVDFFAIGGPCISYELADRHNTFVGICGHNEEKLELIRKTFETSYYHINTTTDVEGFEMASAVKNIYALAVCMAIGTAEKKDGLGARPHYNSQAGLFAQSIREMEIIIKSFGGNAENNIVYGVADLYVTIESGRNREIGVLLGRGYTVDEALEKLKGMTLESITAVQALDNALKLKCEKGEFDMNDIPLFVHVNELVTQGKTVNIPWSKF